MKPFEAFPLLNALVQICADFPGARATAIKGLQQELIELEKDQAPSLLIQGIRSALQELDQRG